MTEPLISTTFFVAGLDCPSEEKLIRKQLQNIPEVKYLDFNFIAEEVTIHHHLPRVDELQQRIEALGMDVRQKMSSSNKKEIENKIIDSSWTRLIIAGVFALCSELSSYFLSNNWAILSGVAALIAIGLSGLNLFKKGFIALRTKAMNINSLMLIAVIGAFFIGAWPEAAMVTVLFALAERIERYSLDKARLAIRSLMQISPEVALVKQENGEWQSLMIEQVKVGSVVKVKPGERIPLDGEIIFGQSTVNQAPVTGESMPVTKQIGDE